MKKSILLCVLLLCMLFHADYVTEGARYGLLLWYTSVVPALFPFMVLSGLIVAGGGISAVMTPVYAVLGRFLPVSRSGCYALVSGLLCGYPMGAKTCADFVRENRISLQEGKFLMAVCNHPSPMFLLGYVYPFFSGHMELPEFLISVYGPILPLAFLAKAVYKNERAGREHNEYKAAAEASGPVSADESILSAVEILCKIGGYLMLFSILIIFLRHAGRIPVFLRLALIAAMEMTTGIREAASSLPYPVSAAVSVASLTFGGFCGLFQTNSVISGNEKKAGLSIRQYFFWKLLHASLSAGIFLLLCER